MDRPQEPLSIYYKYGISSITYVRICLLITRVCTDLFRIILGCYIEPKKLIDTLHVHRAILKGKLNWKQIQLIYPVNGKTTVTPGDLDLAVMFKIVRYVCRIPAHRNGWGKRPQKDDKCIAACLDRIKLRRDYYFHKPYGLIENKEFQTTWDDMRNAVVELEKTFIGGKLFQNAVDDLYIWDFSKAREENTQRQEIIVTRSFGQFLNDGGANIRFINFLDEIAKSFPREKLKEMKKWINNVGNNINSMDVNDAASPGDCLNFLKRKQFLNRTNVLFLQLVLKKIGCKKLFRKCFEYAEKENALCYHEKTQANGYKLVHIHINGNLSDYDQRYIEDIKRTFADTMKCSEKEVQVGGICPSASFFLVLSIKTEHLIKLLTMEQQDKDKLSKLSIDFIMVELNIVFLGPLKDADKRWKEIYITEPVLQQKSTDALATTEKDLGKKLDDSASDMCGEVRHTTEPVLQQKSTDAMATTQKDLEKKLDDSASGNQTRKPQPEVIANIEVSDIESIHHITYLRPKMIWAGCIDTKKQSILNQVDLDGNVIETLNFTECLHGTFAVTQNGDLLYVDGGGHTVLKKTSAGKNSITNTPEHEIIESVQSSQITGDILVGIQVRVEGLQRNGKLIRYDENGKKIHAIETEKGEKALYCRPIYIAENRNEDIVISDATKNRVVLLDKIGKYQNSYKGQTPYKRSFNPHGISTDVRGQILVIDHKSASVHLLDQNLYFLTILLTREKQGLESPRGLCVDENHNLYVGCKNGKINVYKYILDS